MSSISVVGGAPLTGMVRVPGDKSISHRALILAAATKGSTRIRGISPGDDVICTARSLSELGAIIEPGRGGVTVSGGEDFLHEAETVLDVGNSMTAMRLLAGFVASYPWLTVLQGDESVAGRPMDRVVEPLRSMGAKVDGRAGGRYPPTVVRGGPLRGLDYELGVPSAQVKSAVLLAGLRAEGETVVRERVPTRAHTEEMLRARGASIEVEDTSSGRVVVLHPSELRPLDVDVPGDPSQAAFWIVAACVVPGSEVRVEGVYCGPARLGFLDVLSRMGADVARRPNVDGTVDIIARHRRLVGTDVRGPEVPGLIDEVPALAVAAACAEGQTTISDAAELRLKESDRVDTVVAGLSALGARAEPRPDGLAVVGGAPLRGATVESHGDHRVAMALAVAGLVASGATTVRGWEATGTSYPGFSDQLDALRGGG
jgi:3-phosphoshikimate 1-carboxyvinyltransferase